MPPLGITVYGAYWCPDCKRSKKFLNEQFIDYRYVDIEQDPDGEAEVLRLNQGKRIIPTIVFPDGSHLVEPTNAALARKLGLKTDPKLPYYDLVIVGGGPAGLTAAIYAAREGIETLIIERSGLGGQTHLTDEIENFPGFPDGLPGPEFAERLVRQSQRFGVETLQAVDVMRIGSDQHCRCVIDSEGRHYHAGAVLIATGATYRRLNVPGEEQYIGAGIHFCATCDGPFYKGAEEILVIGGGNSAVEEGLHLARYARQVTVVVRGARLTASKVAIDKILAPGQNIRVRFNTVVEAFEGSGARLAAVRLRDLSSGQIESVSPSAVFLFIGLEPNTAFLRDTLKLNPYGEIVTGHDLLHSCSPGPDVEYGLFNGRPLYAFETSMPGVFAAGDVRYGSTNQIASAVGEGAAAALSIREYLKTV
ncbi:MAG: FAD-dependent oxidoreductase [Chloroflexota bacterium]